MSKHIHLIRKLFRVIKARSPGYFFVYAAHFLRLCSEMIRPVIALLKPGGTSFNTQNPTPHKSQKTKAAPETNRAKEFQRGTAGVPESTKEDATGLPEGSDICLGPHSQTFEPHTPDQTLPNRAKEHQTSAKSSGLSLPFFSISCNPKCGNIPKTPTT